MLRRDVLTVAIAALAHVGFLGAARAVVPSNLLLRGTSAEVAALELVDVELAPAAPERERAPLRDGAPPRDEVEKPAATDLHAQVPLKGASKAEDPERTARAEAAATEETSPDRGPVGTTATAEPGALAPSDAPRASDGEYSSTIADSGGSAGLLLAALPFGTSSLAADFAAANAVGLAAPTEAPRAPQVAADAANRVVSSTLLGQDREIGIDLPATQVIVGVVAEAARAAPVPHNTRATFLVEVAPGGKIAGVKVTSSSAGEAGAWSTAATTVKTRLAAKTLDLGSANATGATVIVSATIKHVYPTGSSKSAELKPVCANQIINDIAEQMDDGHGKAQEPSIPLLQDENGRPCIPVGVKGTADLANVGANKQVQVQTSSKVLIQGQEALPSKLPAINKDPVWLERKEGPRPVMPFKARKYKRDREKKK